MIDVVVRYQIASGEMPQALEWSKKVASYVKKAGFAKELTTIRPVTGEQYGFSFVLHYDSMAEYEEQRNKWQADSDFMKIVREGTQSDWLLGIRFTIFERVE